MARKLSELVVKISADLGDLKAKFSSAEASLDKFGEKVSNTGKKLSIGLTAPILALGAIGVRNAAKMDSLNRALESTAGSSQAAAVQLARLREVAKVPGLGFKEAIEGSITLQESFGNIPDRTSLAERSLKGFGNALAKVGRGKDDLDGVIRALGQIASKGKISAEEINQLAERVPQIRQIMAAAFGTADTEKLQKMHIAPIEFIRKIVDELEKMPRVSGGVQNSWENLADSFFRITAKLGSTVIPFLVNIGSRLEGLFNRLEQVNPSVLRWGVALAAVVAGIGPLLILAGSLTQAIVTLRTVLIALEISIAPLVGVFGLAAVGMTALVAWLLKSREATKDMGTQVDELASKYDKLNASQTRLIATHVAMQIEQLRAKKAELEENAKKQTTAALSSHREQAALNPVSASTAKDIKDVDDELTRQIGLLTKLNAQGTALAAAESKLTGGSGGGMQGFGGLARTQELFEQLTNARAAAQEEINKLEFQKRIESDADAVAKMVEKLKELRAQLALYDAKISEFKLNRPLTTVGSGPLAADPGTQKLAFRADRLEFATAEIANLQLQDDPTGESSDGLPTEVRKAMDFLTSMQSAGATRSDLVNSDRTTGGNMAGEFDEAKKAVANYTEQQQRAANDIAGGDGFGAKLKGAAKSVGSKLLSIFNPIGMIGQVFSGALQELGRNMAPIIQILGEALTPVLKALFPVFKLVAIAATYVGQIFFKVAEGIAKAIGALVYGLGVLVKLIPGDHGLGEKIKRAGRNIMSFGDGMGDAADAMGEARKKIGEIKWSDAADEMAAQLRNVPIAFNAELARYHAGMTLGEKGQSRGAVAGGSVTINGGVTVMVAKDDDPRTAWQKVLQGAKIAATNGDPVARDWLNATRAKYGFI